MDINVNYSNVRDNNRYEIEKEYSPVYTNRDLNNNNNINIKYYTKNNSPIANKKYIETNKNNNSPISNKLYKKKFVSVLNNNINNNSSANNIIINNSINNNISIKKFLYQKHKSNIIEYNKFIDINELKKSSKEKSKNNSLNKVNNSLNESKINDFKYHTKNNSPKLLTNSNSNLLNSYLKNFYLHNKNNSIFNISFNNNNNINKSNNENISPVKYIPTNPNNNYINYNKINLNKNLISSLITSRKKILSNLNNKIIVKKSSSSIPLFNIDDYTILSQLGEGSFAKIYLVSHNITHKTFCLKKILTSSSKEFTAMSKEFEIFYKYKHSNILSILAISKKILDPTTYCIYILTEVAKTDWEKEINNRLIRNKFYSENELINILKQLTSALFYLQKNNIAHRDIKVQNILIFPERVFKLADFGEAKKFEKKFDNNNINNINTSTLRGTELYMSPILFEGLKNKIFDLKYNPYKSDVFSLGMCLLFAGTLRIRVLCKIRECKNDKEIERLIRGLLGKRYGEKFINLIKGMLKINEEERYDFEDLKSILDNFVINGEND